MELLPAHIDKMWAHWQTALSRYGYDGAWVSAGTEELYFQDDNGPKFKANPYLSQWVNPDHISPGSHLLLRIGQQPVLFLHAPIDYWHAPPPLPVELEGLLDVRTFTEPDRLLQACRKELSDSSMHVAQIGPECAGNERLGEANPPALIGYLHFHRACKTAYELAAMRLASETGATGHLAAKRAFAAGGTEFDVHMAFLTASQQTENGLPYGNIVAINEHAGVLHYQYQERGHTQPARSMLIDAGGKYRGYASDITRTYAASGGEHGTFAELIQLMQAHQQKLIESVQIGRNFTDLHVQMHRQLSEVLAVAGLISCSAEAAFASGVTEKFCPHGLGHLLGLQVHDVGGHLADAEGRSAPPPPNYPSLRFTRTMEADQVFTIEPGLYFIPSLLAELKSARAPVNWSALAAMQPYGGIRIEDNVRVTEAGVENLTRDAFLRVLHD